MIPASTPQRRGPPGSLWQRAPLWRFSLLSSALLILLCVLYPPPLRITDTARPPALSGAHYGAPPAPAAEPASKADVEPPPVNTPAPRAAATAPPKPRVAPPPPAAAQPATVHLSLATPAGPQPNHDASGIDPALLGRTYHDFLMANGFKVQLPPGEWAMLANTTIKALKDPTNTGMSYFLGQIENKRLIGAIQIITLRSPSAPGTGFVAFENCGNPNNAYSMPESNEALGHQSCWVIHNFFTPPWQQWGDQSIKQSALMRATAGDLAAKGVSYPQDLMMVQFHRAETWGMLEADYLFSPETDHITSSVAPTFRDADWFGPNFHRSPEKLAYLEKLKAWGTANWPAFKTAFDAGGSPP